MSGAKHQRAPYPAAERVHRLADALLATLLPDVAASEPEERSLPELLRNIAEPFVAGAVSGVESEFTALLPRLRSQVRLDVRAAYDGDPACESETEAALCYPGVHAVAIHRAAHELVRLGVPVLPRLVSECMHGRTGIDLHPGAHIGTSFFIDHGTGVVVGATAVIGDHCKLYQGVTLGAASVDRATGCGRKRHPTLEDHVTVYAGATILGGDTVIGAGSVVGAGVFVTHSVPPRHIVTAPRPGVRLRRNDAEIPLSYAI